MLLFLNFGYPILQNPEPLLLKPLDHYRNLVGLALSGLFAFTTLTRSLQLISPNLVASLRTLELVLAFCVQSIITGLAPSLLSCLGGGLILIGRSLYFELF